MSKIVVDTDISIKQVIENLTALRDLSKKEFRHTYDLAISLLGRCQDCMGTGEEENLTKPNSGYSVKISPGGTRIYVTPCTSCHGSGKQLDVNCISCAKSTAIKPEQRHLSYCHECESRLRSEGKVS